jgi:hypothetical protein
MTHSESSRGGLPVIEIRERATSDLDPSMYAALDRHEEFSELIAQGILSLVRTKSATHGLRAGANVGQAVIQGVATIIIRPKVFGALEAMLDWSVPSDVRVTSASSLVSPDSPVLEIFAARFLAAIAAYLTQGRLRRYSTLAAVGAVPRGKLDVKKTISLEGRGRVGVVAFKVRRLTSDLAINQFLALGLLAVDEYVRSTGASPRLQFRARSYSALFEDTSWQLHRRRPLQFTHKLFHEALSQAPTMDAKAAVLYSRALIHSLGAWPTESSAAVTVPNSFFLSLESLFEESVRNVVAADRPGTVMGSVLREPLFASRAEAYVVDPDIVIPHCGGCIVMDTKYKDLQGGLPGHSDVYQILAHARALSSPAALLIYPLESGGADAWHLEELGESVDGTTLFYGQVDVSRLEVAVTGLVDQLVWTMGLDS